MTIKEKIKNYATRPCPKGSELIAAREKFDLSTVEAAAIIYSTSRSWQEWEADRRRMHPQLWEAFLAKARVRKRIWDRWRKFPQPLAVGKRIPAHLLPPPAA